MNRNADRQHTVVAKIRLDEDLVVLVTTHPEEEGEHLWIEGAWNAEAGCSCSHCAPHEQAAPLPHAMRERLIRRCGATTSSGHPCRNVTRDGGLCTWHRLEAG